MIDDTNRDDAFAERIARPLRAPEQTDETFEARVMSAVHSAARDRKPSRMPARTWWLRPRTVQVTPLGALALSATFAAILLASASMVRRMTFSAASPAPHVVSRDTVHVVRFVLVDSNAHRVSIVGAFNGWQKNTTMLHPTGETGVWSASIPLEAGRHEYAFIVTDENGEHWIPDPLSEPVHDDYGTESSAIFVGTQSQS
jgi:hypothetical protein